MPHPAYDSQTSISASLQDFESQDMSTELARTLSRPHLHFRSPSNSEYSDVTDPNLQGSWSPPAWRKAGSGWFRHQQGLASPMHSREGSPPKEEAEARGDDYEQDVTIAAAEIPLPGSPTKGRSLSRSASPERRAPHMPHSGKGSADGSAGYRFPEERKQDSNNCALYPCERTRPAAAAHCTQ